MAGTKNCIRQRWMHLNSSFPDGWRIKPSTFSLNLGPCNWWNASWSEALIFWSRAIVRGRWRRKIGRWRDYEAARWLGIVERDVTQLTSLIANMAMGIEDRVSLSRSAWIHNMPRALIPPWNILHPRDSIVPVPRPQYFTLCRYERVCSS